MALGFGGGSSGSGGGGSTISDPNVAYVRSDGDNGTAVLGDPSKPYLTMQAAYDATARIFDVGVGTFAGISAIGNISVSIRGRGRAETVIALIRSINVGNVTVYDYGKHSFTATAVSAYGAAAPAGGTGGAVTLENVCCVNVYAYGGESSAAGVQGGDGGNPVILRGCRVTGTVEAAGGNGGTGDSENTGGTGGNGGIVEAYFSEIATIDTSSGFGGSDGGSGPGMRNNAGAITLYNSRVGSVVLVGNTAGDLNVYNSFVDNSDQTADVVEGTVNGAVSYVGLFSSGTPTINATVSRINGTTY